jgi:protein SCO1/2
MRRLTWLALLFALSAAAGDLGLKAGVFDPPRQAPEISLQGSNGTPLKMSTYRGKVVWLAFGYTSCPDVCPVTLSVLAAARKQLGALADGVQVIYVTVDPERDDAARMKKFLGVFDPTFVGGTGSPEALAAVRKEYGVDAKKVGTGANYGVAHSSFIYLIDRNGRIVALMPYGHSAEDFAHDARILLKG